MKPLMDPATEPDITAVKCANCICALERSAHSNDQDYFVCPSCGTGDTLDNIMREVREQAVEHTLQRMDSAFAKAVWRSKYLKFKPNRRPKQIYRFIVDLDR